MSQQTQSSVTTESQHALISRCLSKIIKECGRKQKILKDECTRVLGLSHLKNKQINFILLAMTKFLVI
jgi:hypothetical protein